MSVDNLVMTDEEICRSFDEAKNKKNQITILADMNVCKKSQIARILFKYGKITEGTLNSYINSHNRAKSPGIRVSDNKESGAVIPDGGLFQPVPEAVKELLNDRISILENVISEALKEKDELVMYLKKAGKSDGVQ